MSRVRVPHRPPSKNSPGFSQSGLNPGFLLQIDPPTTTIYDFLSSRAGSLEEKGFLSKGSVFRIENPLFLASSTVYAVNSYRSLAGNLRKLVDFQFEVFTVPEAVSLSYQPSDLRGCCGGEVVSPLRRLNRNADIAAGCDVREMLRFLRCISRLSVEIRELAVYSR